MLLCAADPGSCFHDGGISLGPIMKVIVDLCVVPIGVGVHLAPTIAACERVLTEAGLKVQLHPNGTAAAPAATQR